MTRIKDIEEIISALGFKDYKWMNPQDVVVAQWVRIKCTFGCGDFGLGACPPNTPPVKECKDFFNEYTSGLILRFNIHADRNHYPSKWSKEMTAKLLELERQVFLKGYYKAFLLNMSCCDSCKECSGNRIDCKDKTNSRPSPEAFAMDVYQTVRKYGFEINVVSENPSDMNRYAFLLIE